MLEGPSRVVLVVAVPCAPHASRYCASSTTPCFFLPAESLISLAASKLAVEMSSAASSILTSLSLAPPPATSRRTCRRTQAEVHPRSNREAPRFGAEVPPRCLSAVSRLHLGLALSELERHEQVDDRHARRRLVRRELHPLERRCAAAAAAAARGKERRGGRLDLREARLRCHGGDAYRTCLRDVCLAPAPHTPRRAACGSPRWQGPPTTRGPTDRSRLHDTPRRAAASATRLGVVDLRTAQRLELLDLAESGGGVAGDWPAEIRRDSPRFAEIRRPLPLSSSRLISAHLGPSRPRLAVAR